MWKCEGDTEGPPLHPTILFLLRQGLSLNLELACFSARQTARNPLVSSSHSVGVTGAHGTAPAQVAPGMQARILMRGQSKLSFPLNHLSGPSSGDA